MYEQSCRAICPRCGVFFDCEDLFPYDEVITSLGERYIIRPDGRTMGLLEEGIA
jgi:hypothetical protein